MFAGSSYEPYTRIIHQALSERGQRDDDLLYHQEHGAPHYIVSLCQELAGAIGQAGNSAVTVAEVVRLEATCTGTDYHHKLAMRCHRLAAGNL